ncbi:hypothetical protein DICVIV_08895 [Dictyocaulus viviparus]|uniref:Uncharacterized protein n=1 Tax=Dictyocaulus viviparus TaxID=29172 RepID=A0A0D8XKD2_DICVI|nr:hypothetical protein DICVIV_08895 [Dictyocaulus viviparus]
MNAPSLNVGDPGVRVAVEELNDINADEPSLSTQHHFINDTDPINRIRKQYTEWIKKVLNYQIKNDMFIDTLTTSPITSTVVEDVQEIKHLESSSNEAQISTTITNVTMKKEAFRNTTKDCRRKRQKVN